MKKLWFKVCGGDVRGVNGDPFKVMLLIGDGRWLVGAALGGLNYSKIIIN